MRIYCILIIGILTTIISCNQKKETSNIAESGNVEKPNILWLVVEDLSPFIPSFGDSTVVTPNISRLAAEGVRFTNVYSSSGVCAPSRAAIATGMY